MAELSYSLKGDRRRPRQRTRRATRTTELRDRIAEEIVLGRLGPGVALDESEIARRFSVSRTPVREALRALAGIGLVETRAHRSAIVAHPSVDRLRGMFETLAELEALCAALAAEQMALDERQQLVSLHMALGELVPSGDARQYYRMNESFHSLIYVGSHNEYLAELTLATRTRLSPFSRMQFETDGRLSLSHAEHDRVVAAILRGDRDAAAAEMRRHIETVETTYGRYAETAPIRSQ